MSCCNLTSLGIADLMCPSGQVFFSFYFGCFFSSNIEAFVMCKIVIY